MGAEMTAQLAPMMGFSPTDSQTLVTLVRHHLLLADTATRRDLEDPATVRMVTDVILDHDVLDLLHQLTRADSMATGPAVQSQWRERLIGELVSRTHLALAAPSMNDRESHGSRHAAQPMTPRQERAASASGLVVS